MKPLSNIVKNAPKSKIRKLFDMAAGRSDVISLGIGQPDFSTPQPLIDGTIEALKARKTMYAPTRGVPELRNLVAEKVGKENGIKADGNCNVIIANGGSQAITLAMAVILNPGDEVLFSSPNFVSYFYCTQFFQAKVVEIPRNHDLSPNFDEYRKKITSKTKAIIVCSPNNPSGYTYTRKEWEELKDIVIENDLYLISDEVYERFVYDDRTPLSPASLEGMAERTITLNAVSKTYAAPGYRLGYVVASDKIVDLMEKYMQYTVAGVNHAAQYGAITAMKADQDFFAPIKKQFIERRDFVYKRLADIGFEVSKPNGSFYIMPSVSSFNISADDFAMQLMKEKAVAVVPGDIFGSYSADKIRISYAVEMTKLEEAMNRIESFVHEISS